MSPIVLLLYGLVVHLSGRVQGEDLLDEEAHLSVLQLAVGHQELVVQQLCVVRSLVHIFVQTLRDKVAKIVSEFARR